MCKASGPPPTLGGGAGRRCRFGTVVCRDAEAGKAEAGEREAEEMETHSLAARDPLIGPEAASAEHPRAPRVSAISFLFPSLSGTRRARKKKRHLLGSSQKY